MHAKRSTVQKQNDNNQVKDWLCCCCCLVFLLSIDFSGIKFVVTSSQHKYITLSLIQTHTHSSQPMNAVRSVLHFSFEFELELELIEQSKPIIKDNNILHVPIGMDASLSLFPSHSLARSLYGLKFDSIFHLFMCVNIEFMYCWRMFFVSALPPWKKQFQSVVSCCFFFLFLSRPKIKKKIVHISKLELTDEISHMIGIVGIHIQGLIAAIYYALHTQHFHITCTETTSSSSSSSCK